MDEINSAPMAGRTVLVTGGTAGIGRATALGLATMGAHLAITGRDRGRTEDAAREIRAAGGGQVDVFVADLSSQSELRRLADEVLQRLPRIDVLVNNVGGYWNTRHVTADGLERTFALNHLAPFTDDEVATPPRHSTAGRSRRAPASRTRSTMRARQWRARATVGLPASSIPEVWGFQIRAPLPAPPPIVGWI